MRKFEAVSEWAKRTDGIPALPMRGTIGSAGYDFYSNANYKVEPNEIVKIWTDVKVQMNDDEVLILAPRSSQGGKFMLANTIGIIDATYYSNDDNDGSIGIFLKNISKETQYISKFDRIAQGIFINYLTTDDDKTDKIRTGGFGSTGR